MAMAEDRPGRCWPVRIYIEDTDAGGIVYHANYLKYMERARTELLRTLGHGKAAMLGDRLMFVVRSVSLEYRAPAVLDDQLVVVSAVAELQAASLTLGQRVHRDCAAGPLLCEAEVELVLVAQGSLRPRRLPTALREDLMGHLEPTALRSSQEENAE